MIALALLLTGCGEPAAPPTPSQASELHKAPAKPAAQTPALDGPTGLGRAPTPEEIAAFVRRHGLGRLSAADLERLRALAPGIASLGRAVPRTAAKDIAPWPRPDGDSA